MSKYSVYKKDDVYPVTFIAEDRTLVNVIAVLRDENIEVHVDMKPIDSIETVMKEERKVTITESVLRERMEYDTDWDTEALNDLIERILK